jgi:hypothetical protein
MFSMLAALFANRICSELSWNKARISCLAILLVSMLRNRTVNLVKLSAEASGGTTAESLYRRFQNFFLKFAMPLEDVGKLVLSKLGKPADGWVLSMDRTNWKYGKVHINILAVGVVVNKVAVPIVWRVLPQSTKRGNSNTTHRIELMKRLLRILPAQDIRALTMDREFAGTEWLLWLDYKGVNFVARIRKNALVDGSPAGNRRHGNLLRSDKAKPVWGMALYFAGCRITGSNTRDEYLYVVSNRYHGKEATGLYKKRWGIEQVFSHFKKRGFDLETTHMTDASKIEKLFAVITLAFLVSYGWGCQMKHEAPLNSTQKRKSIFRLGLDRIAQLFANRTEFEEDIAALAAWFSRPKYPSFFVV